jgi:hypothetical protein
MCAFYPYPYAAHFSVLRPHFTTKTQVKTTMARTTQLVRLYSKWFQVPASEARRQLYRLNLQAGHSLSAADLYYLWMGTNKFVSTTQARSVCLASLEAATLRAGGAMKLIIDARPDSAALRLLLCRTSILHPPACSSHLNLITNN